MFQTKTATGIALSKGKPCLKYRRLYQKCKKYHRLNVFCYILSLQYCNVNEYSKRKRRQAKMPVSV